MIVDRINAPSCSRVSVYRTHRTLRGISIYVYSMLHEGAIAIFT